MKILLLGSTGRTGELVLKAATEKGYEVNCLIRNADRIKEGNGIKVFEGNPAHKADLEKAIAGCDYVINVLNISRKSDFPWSKLRTPEKYLSEVMNGLVSIAEQESVKRILICSAWGVAETRKDIPKWFKWFIENSNISFAYRDHERQEKILMESSLDWTIIRPAGLTHSKKEEKIRTTFGKEPKPTLTISRKSVARFMVESLESDKLIGKKVVISKA